MRQVHICGPRSGRIGVAYCVIAEIAVGRVCEPAVDSLAGGAAASAVALLLALLLVARFVAGVGLGVPAPAILWQSSGAASLGCTD